MKLIFRNIENETIEVDCTIFDNPLTRKWNPLLEGVQNDFIAYVNGFNSAREVAKDYLMEIGEELAA